MSIFLGTETEIDNETVKNIEGYQYLRSMFPDVSDSKLVSILEGCGDINNCVDQLLNEIAIAKELNMVTPTSNEIENTESALRALQANIQSQIKSDSTELFKDCMKIDSSQTAKLILSKYNNDLWESIFSVIHENEKSNIDSNESISVRQNRETLIKEKIFNRDARYYSFDIDLYLMMMRYFGNDIRSVIYLTEVLLIENDLRDSKVKNMTFTENPKPQSALKKKIEKKNEKKVKIEKGFQLVSNNRGKEKGIHQSKEVSSFRKDNLVREKSSKDRQEFDFVNNLINLDLHGFTRDDSLRFAEAVIQKWWNTELENRIIVGTIPLNSKRIHCVQPLRIITGRGLHSNNGWSILKTGIRKYLERMKFIYEESSGSFLLEGKRC